ncbi:hypothetical protein SOVF_081430, partial [Spinacia oleracea]
SSALTRKLSVAIIDDNPELTSRGLISKEEPPDPRVSTITPSSISFLKILELGSMLRSNAMHILTKCRNVRLNMWKALKN